MGDGEDNNRLIAWNRELAAAHDRLRRALRIARNSAGRDLGAARHELVLYCHGFCLALRGHHESEDTGLFPEIRARHPQLQSVIEKLEQDHEMIGSLLRDLDRALTQTSGAEQVACQLDGIAAIMESHFRYEQRQLLDPLLTLHLDTEPQRLFGPV